MIQVVHIFLDLAHKVSDSKYVFGVAVLENFVEVIWNERMLLHETYT